MPIPQTVFSRGLLGLCLFLNLVLSACAGDGAPQEIETATPEPLITPYRTLTPSRTLAQTQRSLNPAIQPPTPTPTPITYTVVEGDTMLSIALRFGISLEQLMAANPEVNPQFLSIGAELIIPLSEALPPAPATPTPLPVSMHDPVCYPSGEGGAWCFLLVENARSKGLENLSARISLYSAMGESLAEALAIPPLNLIPSSEALPLVAFFAPPLPGDLTAEAELLTALPVTRGNDRYLDAELEIEEVQIATSGLQATVEGSLALPRKSPPASIVWLAAVAYGSQGEVAGVRKWEIAQGNANPLQETPAASSATLPVIETPTALASMTVQPTRAAQELEATSPSMETQATDTGPGNERPDLLEAGEELPFELTVFSLGPEITRVEVVAELRP